PCRSATRSRCEQPSPQLSSRLARGPLISLGLICRQHSHEAADVGIPDVALTIGCHTEWSRIFARESEQTEPSVLEAPEEAATHRTEPDRPIWCNSDSRYGR